MQLVLESALSVDIVNDLSGFIWDRRRVSDEAEKEEDLTQLEVALLLGVSDRTFHHPMNQYAAWFSTKRRMIVR